MVRFSIPLRPLALCLATALTVALAGPVMASPDSPEASAAGYAFRPRLLPLRGTPAAEPLVSAARDLIFDPNRPLMRRAADYADLGRNRTWIDPRALKLRGEQQEVFALAMSDYDLANKAAGEVPLLAAAYVLSEDPRLGARLLEQLREMTRWSPMQRMGWTKFEPGAPLPADDGNSWLATGMGVRAITDALEILGDDPLIAEVRPALLELLRKEIDHVSRDWADRRPWFVQQRNTRTNQWMLPTEGLIRACLVIGPSEVPVAYELGVANLFAALDSFGPAGEFDEGLAYATMTVQSALSAARAMAAAGDLRAIAHPFIAKHPSWYVQHFQPARRVINAFDCVGVSVARRDDLDYREHLALLALSTGSPDATWALRTLFDPAEARSPTALLASTIRLPADFTAPAPFAAYARATRVNWRSSWADEATGIWVRGGHKEDFHDHNDRGHVNFILRGRPVLIEQGMVHYGHDHYSRFAGPDGHNLLQLVGRAVTHAAAPLTVRTLAADGGDITVDATAGHRRLERWHRHVKWQADALEVIDEVKVREDRVDQMQFTWHTGAQAPVKLTGTGMHWRAAWSDAVIEIESDQPLVIIQEAAGNATLLDKKWQSELAPHVKLTVKTADKVNAVQVTLRLRAP
jgi:hypothetical protein